MDSDSIGWLQTTCHWLQDSAQDSSPQQILDNIRIANQDELGTLVDVLVENCDQLFTNPQRLRLVMQSIATRCLQATAQGEDREDPLLAPQLLGRLFERLSDADETSSAHALQMLAAQGDEESIEVLTGILNAAPPRDWQHVALGLSPLWNASEPYLNSFFEQLDLDTVHLSTLSILLDLGGYSLRKGRLAQHPWHGKQQELSRLLATLCTQLESLQREPNKFGSTVEQVQRVLMESVSLSVSLCDALGLLPTSEESVASLSAAMQLSHRRIQVEAAAGLARLGVELGVQRLVRLAEDSVARLRAVRYAEELGIADQIEESLRYPAALAESELVGWLANPEQFGFPPQQIELLDARSLHWPGYEEPRDCYLFKYHYEMPSGPVSNLGIAGPATHAFRADLSPLSVEDAYAAFAGWQAEHDEIYELPMSQLNLAQRREADKLSEVLEHQQLRVVEPLALTFLLGELALLAQVERLGPTPSQVEPASESSERVPLNKAGVFGCAISDGSETLFYPKKTSPNPLTPDIVLFLYRGRKLLRSFNPDY